jgi:hypothetical protein
MWADLRPWLWPTIIPLFIGWMREQFATEGEFGGARWEPLSEQYRLWKEAHYPNRGILYATGDLRKAASLPKRRATPTMLELTVDDSGYAHGRGEARAVLPYHQDGTDRMPARPLLFGDPLPHEAAEQLHARVEEAADAMLVRILGHG